MFGDLRVRALAVYRVHTQSSVYVVGFHEANRRKFVIVRGEPGTDREHVIVRDSEPRIGERSMFDVAVDEWIGSSFEVATMVSSTIVAVEIERDPAMIAAVGLDGKLAPSPWARPESEPGDSVGWVPRPPGYSANPRIVPSNAKGTHPAVAAAVHPLAKQVVLGGSPARSAEPETPYPLRHVLYAENVAALLRSIARRDQLFADITADQRERLRKSLDDSALLLEQIRRRDRP